MSDYQGLTFKLVTSFFFYFYQAHFRWVYSFDSRFSVVGYWQPLPRQCLIHLRTNREAAIQTSIPLLSAGCPSSTVWNASYTTLYSRTRLGCVPASCTDGIAMRFNGEISSTFWVQIWVIALTSIRDALFLIGFHLNPPEVLEYENYEPLSSFPRGQSNTDYIKDKIKLAVSPYPRLLSDSHGTFVLEDGREKLHWQPKITTEKRWHRKQPSTFCILQTEWW